MRGRAKRTRFLWRNSCDRGHLSTVVDVKESELFMRLVVLLGWLGVGCSSYLRPPAGPTEPADCTDSYRAPMVDVGLGFAFLAGGITVQSFSGRCWIDGGCGARLEYISVPLLIAS